MPLPPTHLLFAPVPTISMVEDVVLIDLESILSDWDAYTFSLDMTSPGKKRIVVRIKHPELHKYPGCRPQIRGPDAELIPLENVTLEFKSEDSGINIKDPDTCSVNFEDHVAGDRNDILVPKIEDTDSGCIKTEDLVEDNVKLEDSIENATDRVNTLVPYAVHPLPCHVLTRHTPNPSPEDYAPSKKQKYYIRSFNPSILNHEITSRKETIATYEKELEWENRCHRLE